MVSLVRITDLQPPFGLAETAATPVGSLVCGQVSIEPRILGTVKTKSRIAGEMTTGPRITGTLLAKSRIVGEVSTGPRISGTVKVNDC